MERVLIAGCGDVGTALGLELARAGNAVWGLRRRVSALPDAIRGIAADLTVPTTLAALPAELDLVVYAAAATSRDDAGYEAAYVRGLTNLLEALSRSGAAPRRVIFTSSTAVYGQDDGGWVDERSATEPTGFSGRRMLEAEGLLANGPFPATAVRFGGIYGPGRTRLVEGARSGAVRCSDPPSYTNRIHRDDCARLVAHVAAMASPDPIYVGVDDAPVSRCEVLHWIAAQLGVAAPHDAIATAEAPVGATGKRCSNARVRATGFRFSYPTYREGYRELVRAAARAG